MKTMISHSALIDYNNDHPNVIYNYEQQSMDIVEQVIERWPPYRKDLYDLAKLKEEHRIFSPQDMSLELITEEIKIRIGITQIEIFKIGELLIMGKMQCSKEKQSFKEWIDNSFDFSYETAVNFMNVFKYCFGHSSIVLQIPISILYKITSPSFPDELRQRIFETDILKDATHKRLQELMQKYKEGGIEAINEEIAETILKENFMCSQIRKYQDAVENCLRLINNTINNIKKDFQFLDFETYSEISIEKEAEEIITPLFNAMEKAMKDLYIAFTNSQVSLNELIKKNRDKEM